MNLPKALSALRHRDFRIYWAGQAVSLTGTWMQGLAQAWVLTGLSPRAIDQGLCMLINSLPLLLLSLKAGDLADRVDKRRILIVTQLALMVLAFVFAALVYTNRINIPLIFLMAGLLGVATAFDLPAAQALPAELVAPADIGGAIALMQQIFHGARLLGPAIAGLLMDRFGRTSTTGQASAFVLNGLSFLAVIASLLAIQPPEKRAGAAKKGARGGIFDGLAYVRKDPLIGPLILLAMLVTALVFPFVAVLMVYYVRYVIRSDDASVMGTIMSVSGLGSLLGATAILWGSAATRRYWLGFGVIGVSLALLGLGLFPSPRAAALIVSGLSFSVSSLMGRASQIIQERAPADLRGRVMGVFSIAFSGVMPFASLGISALADAVGYLRVLEGSALGFLVFGIILVARVWRPLSPAPAPAAAGDSRSPPA
jgi:MFS family permease